MEQTMIGTTNCCQAQVHTNPMGYHCSHCGMPVYEMDPYA